MIRKLEPTFPRLTRDEATRFFNMRALPGERRKRPQRLKYFEQLLKDGDFNSPTWTQALIGDDPEPWRGDGQHTSHILAKCADELFPKDLNVTICSYHLDSQAEAGKFFDLFDNPRSVRTNLDKLNIYMAPYPEIRGLDPKDVIKALNGIRYLHALLLEQSKDKPLIEPLLLPAQREVGLYLDKPDMRTFVVWVNQWHDTQHNAFLAKCGIMAEIYNDWKSYPHMANQFWTEVLTESNPDPDDYTRDLSRTFLEWSNRKGHSQLNFRDRAQKIWERYKRTMRDSSPAPAAPSEETAVPPTIFPPSTGPSIEAIWRGPELPPGEARA